MRTLFFRTALDCGLTIALVLATSNGITQTQLDLWVKALPEYRSNHHYI